MPLRGEVWLIDLDPTKGHEQRKMRPCVIVSNDAMNRGRGLSIVIPFTSTPLILNSGKLSPLQIEIRPPEGGTNKLSYTLAYQVRTVDHSRFVKKLGALSDSKLAEVVHTLHTLTSP
jgi:mRNA interferase MazF